MTAQLVVTGSVLALVYLMMIWVDGFSQSIGDDNAVAGRGCGERLGLEKRRREQFALPIGLILKFAVLVLSVPLIMLQWGYRWTDISEWYYQLFFGFRDRQYAGLDRGGVRLGDRVRAGLRRRATVPGLARWASAASRPGSRAGCATGSDRRGLYRRHRRRPVRDLLCRLRPVEPRPGGRCILGRRRPGAAGRGQQLRVGTDPAGRAADQGRRPGGRRRRGGGWVRKISVRSTEIETGDRANVLMPNSYFISETVKNWTLREVFGRIVIAVRTWRGQQRPAADVRHPAPGSRRERSACDGRARAFRAISTTSAADSLNFKLYAFTYDLTQEREHHEPICASPSSMPSTQAGIRIAFLQADVTVRNIDRLREAVSEYVSAAPGNGAGSGNGKAAAPSDGHLQRDRLRLRAALGRGQRGKLIL